MRLDIGCDHFDLAEMLRRDVFELVLHRPALHVLRAQAERRECARIDLSATIDARHRPALAFDGFQHRRRPVRPIAPPDTRDEGAAQIIVTDADCHHRAPLAFGQDGPIGFDPLVVASIEDPETVDMIRYTFKSYLQGTADGPIGVTGLAHHLNERGYRIRGKRFSVGTLHNILTNTAYIGYVIFNRRDSRTGETRPETEWAPIPVPPIIDEDTFYAVRQQMADRDPRMGEAAAKTNMNLLTSRAICG